MTAVKNPSHLKWILIAGTVGAFISAFDILALTPVPPRAKSLVGGGVLITAGVAFLLVVNYRSKADRGGYVLWVPGVRIYGALISLLVAAAGTFRIAVALGLAQETSLIAMALVVLVGYLVALLPKSAEFLSGHAYPRNGLHAMFLSVLAVILLSFAIRVV